LDFVNFDGFRGFRFLDPPDPDPDPDPHRTACESATSCLIPNFQSLRGSSVRHICVSLGIYYVLNYIPRNVHQKHVILLRIALKYSTKLHSNVRHFNYFRLTNDD